MIICRAWSTCKSAIIIDKTRHATATIDHRPPSRGHNTFVIDHVFFKHNFLRRNKQNRTTVSIFRYFSKFQYCRYAPRVRKCEPKGDGISSFNNLLEAPVLRVCIWIVATLTLLGNIGVFLVRCKVKSDSQVHSLIIRNLCGRNNNVLELVRRFDALKHITLPSFQSDY